MHCPAGKAFFLCQVKTFCLESFVQLICCHCYAVMSSNAVNVVFSINGFSFFWIVWFSFLDSTQTYNNPRKQAITFQLMELFSPSLGHFHLFLPIVSSLVNPCFINNNKIPKKMVELC